MAQWDGRVFYFRPGHETFPIYHHPQVMKVIFNAVFWAAPAGGPTATWGETPESLELIVHLGTAS